MLKVAFAAILEDGSVVTWGSQYHRSEMLVAKRAVQDQRRGVRRGPRGQPRGSSFFQPFAGIVEDGSFITLGAASYGGDSSGVEDQLKGV